MRECPMRVPFILLGGLAVLVSACSNPSDATKKPSPPAVGSPPEAKPPSSPTRPPQPTVRVVVHPQNPFVLYVTNLPSSSERSLFGLPVPTEAPADGKFFVVDLQTGEWREVPLKHEVGRRFKASHPHILFQAHDEPRSRTRDEFP
jgi:hypothetical protein